MSISRFARTVCAINIALGMLVPAFAEGEATTTTEAPKDAGSLSSDDLSNMSLEDLMNVTITAASKKEEKISEVPASIIVITRDQIEKNGYRNLEDILRNTSGFNMIEEYYWLGGENFGVRGFFTASSLNSVVVLVNGVSQHEDYWNSFNLAKVNIPVQAIDRIEIVRGPMSVIYGSGAFLGAINIITKEPTAGTGAGQGSISVGDKNAQGAFARTSGKEGDLKYVLNAGIYKDSQTGGSLSKMLDPSSFATDRTTGWGLSSEDTKVPLGQNRRYVSLDLQDKGLKVGLQHSYNESHISDNQFGDHGWDTNTWTSTVASMGYAKKIDESLNIETKLRYSETYEAENLDLFMPSFPSLPYTLGKANEVSNSYDVEVNANYVTEKLDLVGGLFRSQVLQDEAVLSYANLAYAPLSYSLAPNETITTHAAYLQGKYKLADGLQLVAGVRVEKMEDYKLMVMNFVDPLNPKVGIDTTDLGQANWIPRLALVSQLNPTNTLKLLYGRAIRNPAFGENNEVLKQLINRGRTIPKLKPANVETVELNYQGIYGRNFQLNTSIYQTSMKNMIYRGNQTIPGSGIVFTIGNIEPQVYRGAELNLTYMGIPKLKLELDLNSMVNADPDSDANGGKPIGYFPKNLAYLKGTYEISEGVTGALVARYVGSMYAKWDINSTPPGRIGDDIPAMTEYDLNFRWNKMHNDMFAAFSIQNVLDTEIKYPITDNSTLTSPNVPSSKSIIGRSRSFLVTLGTTF